MLIKKQFRCFTAHVCLVKREVSSEPGMSSLWGIIVTSCCTNIGQQMFNFEDYHSAIKQYNFLKTLTAGIES